MKIFGTIYPFIETDEDSYKLGRHVANYEFFKVLLRESNFDEFHIFCLSVSHFTITRDKLQQESIPENQKKKIRLFLFNHLVENIRTTEYHIFHLGGWGYFFPGLVYLRNTYAKNKFPITGLIHSLNGIETNYHALKICTAPLLPYDSIICSSNAGKMVLEKIFIALKETLSSEHIAPSFKGNTEIIPLGIDNTFLDLPDKSSSRSQFSLRKDDIVLLTVGRLSPQTKADVYPLIKTFQKLTSAVPDKSLILVIAGGANDKQMRMIRQIIAECHVENAVHLITNFTKKLKPHLYSAADIYISLSDNLQETFGISVIEAMAAGIPAVVSDINGYSELVTDNETGYKIPTLWTDTFHLAELADIMDFGTLQLMLSQCMAVDTEILFNHLLELVNNEELRQSMGANAKKEAVQKYLWSRIIHTYEALWDDLYTQSSSYAGDIPTPKNPFTNDYLHIFNHYPTSQLSKENVCSLTQDGQEVLKSGNIPMPYMNIDSLINNTVIIDILKYLSKNAGTVTDILLLDSLKQKKQDEIFYTLLWMAKYSLIHIS